MAEVACVQRLSLLAKEQLVLILYLNCLYTKAFIHFYVQRAIAWGVVRSCVVWFVDVDGEVVWGCRSVVIGLICVLCGWGSWCSPMLT